MEAFDADVREALARERAIRLDTMKRIADKHLKTMLAHGRTRITDVYEAAARDLFEREDGRLFTFVMSLKRVPVSIREFLESKDFVGGVDMDIWPQIKQDIIDVNRDIVVGEPLIHEYIDSGATGCHARGTLVLMADGTTKPVEMVRVGEALMGPDSLPRRVMALARGRETMVRVTPNKGEPFVVNMGHMLSLKRTRRRDGDRLAGQVINVTVRDYMAGSATFKHMHKLWRTGCEFPDHGRPLVIPPYILGLWLGDGTSAGAELTNVDPEPLAAWRDYAKAMGLRITTDGITHAIVGNGGQWDENPVRRALKDLSLLGNKHIPHHYLTSARQDRLDLLAGLIDTDGNLSCGGYEIVQKRESMARGICFLARSLGFRVTTTVKAINGTTYHRVFISGPVSEIPVRISRKQAKPYRSTRGHTVEGFTLEVLPEDDYFGFALDGDHLYLTADFMVHHNTGKTTKASITNAYQLYLLHCINQPQRLYGLAEQTPIVMTMASSNLSTTHAVLFKPFYTLIENMPFFQKYAPWNKDRSTVMDFEKHISVVPVNADTQGIIGRAVISGHIDEANYMDVKEQSARAERGRGGSYDQAANFYAAIKLRRRSRFSSRMPVPGMIILSSSTRYLDDFLDRRIAEVQKVDEPGVRIFRHKQYEVQPPERFSAARFRLLVGTAEYPTRILGPEEVRGVDFPENGHVEEIPEDYRYEFLHRPEDALRDVCGISTVNLSPFITQRQKIMESVERWKRTQQHHPVARANVDLLDHGMPVLVPDLLDVDTTTPRFVHIDLSKSKDRCGISMVRVDRMVRVPSGDGVFQNVPHYVVELAVSIRPSAARQIDIAEVRNWVVTLKAAHNVPIYMITYDGYASEESIQTLRRMGIRSEVVSMDRTDEPYTMVRRALYEDRLDLPDNDILVRELTQLERNSGTGKIDHPPKGSKDLSDAVAGAVYAATTSRHYRTQLYYTDAAGNKCAPPTR